ncbi:Gamma-glutamyl cyclotransferase-like protein [Dioscorea alata]|uniref:Gamma-glutamyl cyclotransferase-like protein n=1 Tax=Dioscorea alata TaxID=55571 RepID=A0ACB7VKP2_DIOAL|nr:Gamma-glutamyl cyclotransferase-like protein [Dioscorea alata]
MSGAVATALSTTTSSPGGHNVFVYGSLLADEVVRVLLKRVPLCSNATLIGFHRFSIKGRVYPAILPVENKKVTGKVLLGITDVELDVLDTFEDVEYERRTVEINLHDTSEKLLAETYVWGNEDDPDLYGDWDFEVWKQLHMKDFLAMTTMFANDLEQPETKTRVDTYESYYQKD